MLHEMRLEGVPFNKIKNGTKTIELRLNDVKRRALKVGDTITFTNRVNNEKMDVQITGLNKYPSFKELFASCDKSKMGFEENEEAKPDVMLKYYPEEEIKKYGALAIELKRL